MYGIIWRISKSISARYGEDAKRQGEASAYIGGMAAAAINSRLRAINSHVDCGDGVSESREQRKHRRHRRFMFNKQRRRSGDISLRTKAK